MGWVGMIRRVDMKGWIVGCVDFEIFLIFNLGLIIFDGDGYSNGHKSQKNNFQIYLDPPQID